MDYNSLILVEQDVKLAHRYLTDDFDISKGKIVVDVGAEEDNFALEIIDKVSMYDKAKLFIYKNE